MTRSDSCTYSIPNERTPMEDLFMYTRLSESMKVLVQGGCSQNSDYGYMAGIVDSSNA